ncbi:hypothetical protein PVAP13_3NG201952 [Panicum virgatum]|uniref:Uncharacterized protein n=1 Tax=Panicum virgatum TaxID=38727 RepID=A0A8T0U9G9_PANVG|nr:hypothetical protein PVAP13_3NG201952 [Panicum virgatum]
MYSSANFFSQQHLSWLNEIRTVGPFLIFPNLACRTLSHQCCHFLYMQSVPIRPLCHQHARSNHIVVFMYLLFPNISWVA